MIGLALILGAGILVGGLVAKYWNNIINFMKMVINKLKPKIRGIIMGSAVFIKKLGDEFQNRTKYYSKNEVGKWKETIVTYQQPSEEIPEKYRQYALIEGEYDLTSELEMQLTQA